jgi:hypothetical protein
MKDILSAVVMLGAAWMLWGLGHFALRKCDRSASFPVCIGVGLAVLIFAGGILNCAHIARGPVLWMLAIAVVVVSFLETRQFKFEPIQGRAAWIELITAGLVIAGVTGFAIHTQLPPRAFNYDDDFQKYFCHPICMLATGTVLGSPLGGLGSTTLGAQPFLQGYVLSVLPIGYINGVDAVFGLMLLMLICASAGWRRFPSFPGAVLGPVMVAIISPDYVNVSGLYIGGVLMATAVMLVVEEEEESGASALILGLLYAALVAVKPTFALFPVLHLSFSTLKVESEFHPWRDAMAWAGKVVLWAGVGVAPWIATHWPNYIANGNLRYDPTPSGDEGGFDLLSLDVTKYGDSALSFTLAVGCVALVAIGAAIFGFAARPGWKRRQAMGVLAAGAACVVGYLTYLCLLGPAQFGYTAALRYYIPMLLGPGVLAIVLLPRISLRLKPEVLARFSSGFCAVFVVAFVGSTVARYQRAAQYGSILAFEKTADTDQYANYCQYCLSKGTAQRIRDLQSRIPAGEPVLALLSTPFLLDFHRNLVIDVEPACLLTPWARVPSKVRYVLWQVHPFKNFGDLGVTSEAGYQAMIDGPGYQDRTIGVRSLAFVKRLAELRAASKIIYEDDEFVIFKLDGPFKWEV